MVRWLACLDFRAETSSAAAAALSGFSRLEKTCRRDLVSERAILRLRRSSWFSFFSSLSWFWWPKSDWERFLTSGRKGVFWGLVDFAGFDVKCSGFWPNCYKIVAINSGRYPIRSQKLFLRDNSDNSMFSSKLWKLCTEYFGLGRFS